MNRETWQIWTAEIYLAKMARIKLFEGLAFGWWLNSEKEPGGKQEGGKEKMATAKAQSREKAWQELRNKEDSCTAGMSQGVVMWQEAGEDGLPHLQSQPGFAAMLDFMTGANKNLGKILKQANCFNGNQLFKRSFRLSCWIQIMGRRKKLRDCTKVHFTSTISRST